MKRFLEFLLSGLLLAVSFPFLLFISGILALVQGRPVLFLQERIGFRKKHFRIWKFRTMQNGTVTRLGYWFRKMGLDELPQIWNIFWGDMSFIGPRPLTNNDLRRLKWEGEWISDRWSVRPGVTGLSQLYSGQGAKVSLCLDRYYLKHRSFFLDFKIAVLTLSMNFFGIRNVRNFLWERLKKRDRGYHWGNWLKHFRKNAERPYPEVSEQVIGFIPQKRLHVAKSLAIFQLGEAGEGKIAKQIDFIEIFGVDRNYREALKLFVKEEGRHARILGDCVKALRGELISSNWTEKLFHFGRRLLGTRFKLMVLLVAEVVGICFYKKIAEKIPFGSVRSALMHIAEDEEKHLIFHSYFFKIRLKNPLTRVLFKLIWRTLAFAACVSVLSDHRKTFRALGISFAEAISKFKEITLKSEAAITGSLLR